MCVHNYVSVPIAISECVHVHKSMRAFVCMYATV